MTILLGQDQPALDTQRRIVLPEPSGDDHRTLDNRTRSVVPASPAGIQRRCDPHTTIDASGDHSGGGAGRLSPTNERALDPRAFAELRMLADSFEDAQKARIAIENRLRSGTDSEPVAEALKSLCHAEGKLSLAMQRSFRVAAPEVSAWAKTIPGIGVSSDRLIARLIGAIGHPVIASPYHWQNGDAPEGHECDPLRCKKDAKRHLIADPPYARTVSQLWSYCGHGDPTRRPRKGMSADDAMGCGNPRAKMLTHLLAEGAMKCVGSASAVSNPISPAPTDAPPDRAGSAIAEAFPNLGAPTGTDDENGDGSEDAPVPRVAPNRRRSPYRDVYDLARLTYADRVEADGKPWSLGHQHNAALRLVGKSILRDLWEVSS